MVRRSGLAAEYRIVTTLESSVLAARPELQAHVAVP